MTAQPLDPEGLEAYFTDVEDLRELFEQYVGAGTLPKRLLVIHGVGGVGKTSLLRMFRLHCKSLGVPIGMASGDEDKSAADILARWTQDLKADGVKLSGFTRSFDQYRAIQAKVEERVRKAGGKAGGLLAKAASKTAEAAAGAAVGAAVGSVVPGVGTTIGAIAGGVLGGTGADALLDWLRGFLSKPEVDLLLDPTERLANDFLNDVADVARKRRLVLIVDTFEQMTTLDAWTRELAQRLHPNVLLVIAGRGVPDWSRGWPGWLAQADIRELEPLSEEDMRELVHRYYAYIRGGQPDPEQVEKIIHFARGLPMVVNSAVRLWVEYGVEDFEVVRAEVIADLVDRLREGVSPDVHPALEAAAAVRWFNRDILRAVTGQDDVHAVYDELRRFPFVRSRVEGLALHDAVREMMDESLRVHDRAQHRLVHERAAVYFEAQLEEVGGQQSDAAKLELLYHRLQTDEAEGVALLERLFEQADRLGQQELKLKLLDEASEHVLQERRHEYRLQYLKAQLDANWEKREALLKDLLGKKLDDDMRVKVLRALTAPLAYQGKRAQARRYLEEALAICERRRNSIQAAWTRLDLCWQVDVEESRKHIAHAIEAFREAEDDYGIAIAEAQLGWNHLNRWQPVESREAFFRSLALLERLNSRRQAAFIQERIGQTYLIEGDFQHAIAFKEQALTVFKELQDEWNIAWTLDELATCYRWVGRWELTLKALERALKIFTDWGDHRRIACMARQASVYRKQGRIDLALETYQRALNENVRHSAWARQEIYAGMGHIHLARGDFAAALADYQQAIKEFQDDGMELEARLVGNDYLGTLYLSQGMQQMPSPTTLRLWKQQGYSTITSLSAGHWSRYARPGTGKMTLISSMLWHARL